MSKSRSGKARSGGGIRGNKNVKIGVNAGPRRTNVISPSAVADVGAAIGYKRLPLIKATAPQVPLGNELATNVGRGAPGAGRTVYPCGYQDQHGTPAKGEPGMQGAADRGPRAILGPQPSNPGNKPALPQGQIRRGQQVRE
jgi:hypothetical protein